MTLFVVFSRRNLSLTMAIAVTHIILIIFAAISGAIGFSDAIIEESEIIFQRRQGTLKWPLADLFDPARLIHHAVHCFNVMQDFEKNDRTHVLHRSHCRQTTARALGLLESNRRF